MPPVADGARWFAPRLLFYLVLNLIRKRAALQAIFAALRARGPNAKGRAKRAAFFDGLGQDYGTVARYAIKFARSSTLGRPANDILVPGT